MWLSRPKALSQTIWRVPASDWLGCSAKRRAEHLELCAVHCARLTQVQGPARCTYVHVRVQLASMPCSAAPCASNLVCNLAPSVTLFAAATHCAGGCSRSTHSAQPGRALSAHYTPRVESTAHPRKLAPGQPPAWRLRSLCSGSAAKSACEHSLAEHARAAGRRRLTQSGGPSQGSHSAIEC